MARLIVSKRGGVYNGKQALTFIKPELIQTNAELQELNLDKLVNGISVFVFMKKDGSPRKAIGTCNPAILEKLIGKQTQTEKPDKKLSITSQPFFDLESMGWKAYQLDSLICIIN